MFWHRQLLPGGALSVDCRLRTTDGGEFVAQRAFLRNSSPYFQALFGEENGSPRDVLISGATASAIDILLTFLYTDELLVTSQNVTEVLHTADMLLLDAARERCLKVLVRCLAPENCLCVAKLTHRYKQPDFRKTVMAYARENFDQAWRLSDDFGKTPGWLLYELVVSPELNVTREGDVLEAIARWKSTASAEEKAKLQDLLLCVRIGRCDPGYLDSFEERWPALAATSEFQETIAVALNLGPCQCTVHPLLQKLCELEKEPPQAPQAELVPTTAAAGAENLDEAGQAYSALKAVAVAAAALLEAAVKAANSVALEVGAAPVAPTQAAEPTPVDPGQEPVQQACDAQIGGTRPMVHAPCQAFAGKLGSGRRVKITQNTATIRNDFQFLWDTVSLPELDKRLVFAGALCCGPAVPSGAFESLRQVRCSTCGLFNPERWLPRLPAELIFLVGGWSQGRARSTIEAYDTEVRDWFQFKDEAVAPRAYHGVVQWRRKLFVVGGLKLRSYLRSVDSLDLESCEWEHHSPMLLTRAYVAVAAQGEYIYAIGGHTGVERTRTVERYQPLRNQWLMVADMSRRRSDASACAHKGRIFVSGGFSGSRVLQSVEVYTPSTDSWSLVQPMPSPRCSHRMIAHCGRLYVIGGFDGHRRLDNVLQSVHCVPPRWREIPSFITPRSSFAVAQLGDDIYVIGGYNGTNLIAGVERYTPGDDRWREAKPLSAPAGGLSGCAVRGLNVCAKFSARGALLPLKAK